MNDRRQLYAFFAGVETFHALVHAYFSITKADIKHPVELLGVRVTPRLHAGAAVVNAAIALGLGARAFHSARTLRAVA